MILPITDTLRDFGTGLQGGARRAARSSDARDVRPADASRAVFRTAGDLRDRAGLRADHQPGDRGDLYPIG